MYFFLDWSIDGCAAWVGGGLGNGPLQGEAAIGVLQHAHETDR